ncbi:hypothetical protein B566_EDAN009263, partial [Ephemera danica]
MHTRIVEAMSENSSDVFVSFIKINGKSILPPLLDEAKREEMRHYRDLAISVGLKIKQQKQNDKVKTVIAVDESTITVEEPNEPLSPTLTASTDLNQFLDSTLDASPQPPTDTNTTPGRLIRSASYTLDQPSVSLLAIVEQEASCSALQGKSPKHSVKSPKKVVCRRKKKLLASPRLSKKHSNTKTNKSVYDASMKIDGENDDLHLDLDLHLDIPSTIAGAYLNNYESVAIQTISSNHVSTQINILDTPQFHPALPELQPCPKLLNDDECNNGVFSDSKICQFTLLPDEIIEEIIEKDLINFESDAFDEEELQEQNEESCTVQNIVRRSQSTPEFSRAATATQTDLSPISQDDTSCSLSETEEIMSTSRTEGQDLHTMVTNIQSEYEMKLNALMKQQEIEKQKLKEQFLLQQDLLFQKLSISLQTSPRTPLPNAPSPPIHQTRGESSTPKKPLPLELCQKFARLPALVRGYLTRRLMHTERVQNIKATVRETLNLALHDIFFSLPLPKRLHIITLDRERLRRGSSSARSSSGSRISSATLKAQQRRQQLQQQQQNSVSPHTGPGRDVSSGIIQRRSRSQENKICFHRSTSDSSTKQ